MSLQLGLGRARTSTADGSRARIIASRLARRENPAGNLVREVASIASGVAGEGTIKAIHAQRHADRKQHRGSAEESGQGRLHHRRGRHRRNNMKKGERNREFRVGTRVVVNKKAPGGYVARLGTVLEIVLGSRYGIWLDN